MYPDKEVGLSNMVVMFGGEGLGEARSIEATTSEINIKDENQFEWNKSYEGTLNVEYTDEKFFEYLGLYEFQKVLLRKALQKQRMESAKKKKKLSMRESMNNHFKRGKKW